jgi:hypothetical protein
MTASGINHAGSAPRLRRFLELASRHNPVNLGDIRTGSTFSQTRKRLLEAITDGTVLHAVFSGTRDVASFLADLKAEDLGISIVVSGLMDTCRRIAARTGLKPHTVAVSLGIWGRTETLPGPSLLEVTSMCGHGMIPGRLVEKLAEEVASGALGAREAAARLARPCVCGIFNPRRAAALVRAMARRIAARSPRS